MNHKLFFSTRKSTSTTANRQNILDLEAPKMNTLSTLSLHKIKFVLVLFAFVLFGTLASAFPAAAQTPEKANIPVPCVNKCLRVSNIAMTGKDPAGLPTITAVVTVKPSGISVDTPAPILSGVQVYGYWTLPSGTTMPAYAKTNAEGQAVFQVNDAPGTFTFTIMKIVKTNYTFDRLNSVLSATLR